MHSSENIDNYLEYKFRDLRIVPGWNKMEPLGYNPRAFCSLEEFETSKW